MTGTPSMDDKATPSPPTLTVEEYEAIKHKGLGPRPMPTYGEKLPAKSKVSRPAAETAPYQPLKTFRECQLEAAINVAERLRLVWEKAKAAKEAMIADAVATKSSLPNNFWLEEHRARAHYGAALQLVEALS